MNTRMDRSRLHIGAYLLQAYARTEEHVKDVAESGVDHIIYVHSGAYETFDLFEKYGLGVVTWGPLPHWGGPGYGYVGRMEEKFPLSCYTDPAAAYKDHPAVWGIDIGDEPNSLDFPYIGKIVSAVNAMYPNQFPYLNLYPNYATVVENSEDEIKSDLGTMTYKEYIDRYCAYVPTDYISFDFYLYYGKKDKNYPEYGLGVADYYENLRLVSEACRNTGRSLWLVAQLNSPVPEVFTSLNQMRFQAFTAMSFGVENIMWGCYTAGWWTNQVLDEQGNKTEQYEKLKQVNKEIRTMADEYMKFRNVYTHFVGLDTLSYFHFVQEKLNQESKDSVNTGVFLDVKADNGAALTIGQMVSRNNDGSHALMICASDDPYDFENQSYNIVFRVNNRNVRAIGGNGDIPVTKLEDGSYSVPISSNLGVLIVAE